MAELPRQSYSRDVHGIADDELRRRCSEVGVRLNRVEADVMFAVSDGYTNAAEIVGVTGLTKGQVLHAMGILVTQGLADNG